ncbi:MAG: FkbM family methyltransferase [Pseudomonadota bacterium]
MSNILARCLRATQLGLWRQPKQMPLGPELYGNSLDGTYQMIARGAYGDFVYRSLLEAPASCALLDIGANIGLFSIALAPHFGQRVFSFEPNPETFQYLQRNLEHAKLEDVTAICGGVVNSDRKSLTLNTRKFHSGAASMAHSFGWRSVRISLIGPSLMTAIVATDDPLAIKVDVEGAEFEVVSCLDACGILPRCERLVIEMSAGTNDAAQLDEIRHIVTRNGLTLEARHGTDHFGDELFVRT